jgi:O-antigen/teichoic acid export membrane protein
MIAHHRFICAAEYRFPSGTLLCMVSPSRVRGLTARATAGPGVVGALGWVAIGSMVANAAAYVVYLGAGRWLTPGDYGQFARLLSAMLVLGVPALALQAVIARDVVRRGPAGRAGAAFPAALRSLTWRTAGCVAVLAAIGVPIVAALAHTDTAATAAALATAPVLVIIAAGQGVLQGRGEFRTLAWVLGAVGLLRSVPTLVAFALGGSPLAGLLAGTVGALAAAALIWSAVRWAGGPVGDIGGHREVAPPIRTDADVAGVLRASQVQLVLVVAMSVDLLLSGTVLSADDAGVYALGAVATKAAFWLPQAIGVVFYPRLADPARSRESLRHAVAVVAVIGAALTIGAGAVGPLVPIVIGDAYRPLVPLLWLFAYTGSAMAILQVLLLSAIAADRTRVALLTWAAVLIEAVVILTVVQSVPALVLTAAVTVTVAVAVTGRFVTRPEHRSRQ